MMSITDKVDEDLAEYDFVDQREQEVKAHIGSVSFEGLTDPILLSQDLSGGCGGKIWECANVIIDYFIWKNKQTNGEIFKNKKILEIGAGTGLVGLTMAKICPEIKQLTLTDQLPMMSLMEQNIELNHLSDKVKARIFDWGDDISQDLELAESDIVVASDCIYLEAAFIPLMEAFFSVTQKPDSYIYLMYKKRRSADKRFFQMARKKFDFEDVMDDPKREQYIREGFRLFIVKRKAIKQQQSKKSSIQED